jgi:hypothetical protein
LPNLNQRSSCAGSFNPMNKTPRMTRPPAFVASSGSTHTPCAIDVRMDGKKYTLPTGTTGPPAYGWSMTSGKRDAVVRSELNRIARFKHAYIGECRGVDSVNQPVASSIPIFLHIVWHRILAPGRQTPESRSARVRSGKRTGLDPHGTTAGGGPAGGHVAAFKATRTGSKTSGDDTSVDCRPEGQRLVEYYLREQTSGP